MRDPTGTEPTLASSPAAPSAKHGEESRLGGSLAEAISVGLGARESTGLGAIAEYDLLRELGRGGMGVVYLARQRGLNRLVALKTILATSRDKSLERFRIEAEAAANLRHPGIVSVYDVGCENGCHFYSMEYVEGRNLAEVVRERSLSGREAAEYVASVADAMHYAHEHGILHRDLKPSNVLIDPEGRLKVADFGLAKRVDGDSELTGDAMLGTPSYMPPEQALPSRGVVGRHSDVYSLGAVLYFLLTCRPPFRADTPLETVRQMLAVEPVAPRLLNPRIPRDIETICLKCLEKDSKRRYASAGDLADELRRFLRGEPIVARPLNRAQRGWRWCRRHPSESALGAIVVLVLLLGVAGVTWQWQRAQRNLARATVAFERLNTASDQMLEVVEDWVVRLPLDSGDEQDTLRSTLGLYEQYLLEEPTNRAARVKLAETHHRVAEIRRNLGQHDEAIQHFAAALSIYEQAAAEGPLDPQFSRRIAHERDWLGETQREAGRLEAAQANLDTAVVAQEALMRESQDEALRGELARSLLNRALLWNDLGKTTQAMDDCRRAIELFAFESTRKPTLSSAHQQLARCRINLGMMLREAKAPGPALEQYAEAADLLRDLTQSPPPRTRVRELRSELAQTQLNRGNLLLTARNDLALAGREPLAECERAFQEALDILQGLVLEYPSVVSFQSQLANAYNGLGAKHQVAKEPTAAAGMFHQARTQFETLLRRSPANADFASRLAIAQANLASLAAPNELPQRMEWLEQAVRNQSRAAELAPKSALYIGLLKRHRQALARAYLQDGRHAEAAEQAEWIGESRIDGWKDSLLAAQLYVRALEAARDASKLSAVEREQLGEKYAKAACRWLSRAMDEGWKNRVELDNREQFGSLFERDEFRALQTRSAP